MKSLLPWLLKALFSAIYWLGCLYVAVGIYMGDRVTPEGIRPVDPPLPPLVFAVLALALYAFLSMIYDRRIVHSAKPDP